MVQESGGLNITTQDMAALLQANPLAAEQVKVIALQRMLREKQAEMDALRSAKPAEAPGKKPS